MNNKWFRPAAAVLVLLASGVFGLSQMDGATTAPRKGAASVAKNDDATGSRGIGSWLSGLVGVEKPSQTGPYTIGGVSIVDIHTGKKMPIDSVDIKPTLDRIAAGKSNRHPNDGSVFHNRSRSLPIKPSGYYREYVVPTQGVSGPGPQRLVIGKEGEVYYTPDHYNTFILMKRE